jgi:hypothetical protein
MDDDSQEDDATIPPNESDKGKFDPLTELAEAEKQAADYLNNRCRVISGAIIVAVWGLLEGESKSIVELSHNRKTALLAAAALGLLALFSDYFQYLLQYLNVRWQRGPRLGWWGGQMFKIKQFFTVFSVATFATVATLLLIQSTKIEAEPRVKFAIYKGSVWSNTAPAQKKPSKLYLKPPNPVTGNTQATEDDVACTGSQSGNVLILLCNGVRFEGIFENRTYKGQWIPTSTSQQGGGFEYRYVQTFP